MVIILAFEAGAKAFYSHFLFVSRMPLRRQLFNATTQWQPRLAGESMATQTRDTSSGTVATQLKVHEDDDRPVTLAAPAHSADAAHDAHNTLEAVLERKLALCVGFNARGAKRMAEEWKGGS